jgi:hypothetical protein
MLPNQKSKQLIEQLQLLWLKDQNPTTMSTMVLLQSVEALLFQMQEQRHHHSVDATQRPTHQLQEVQKSFQLAPMVTDWHQVTM